MPAAMFALLAEEGELADWREAYYYGHLKVGGDPRVSAPARAGDRRRLSRRWRARGAPRQLPHRPADVRHPADVARVAGPVQAQEPRAAGSPSAPAAVTLDAADVDRARTRGTVAAARLDDAQDGPPDPDRGRGLAAAAVRRPDRALVAQAAPDFGLDRCAQDRALAAPAPRRRGHGPLTRPELAERLTRGGLRRRAGDQGPPLAAGDARRRALSRPRPRRPDLPGADARTGSASCERRPRDESLAELARRYIRAYGPAGERDFARWAGTRAARLPARARADRRRAGEVRVGGRGAARHPSARPPSASARLSGCSAPSTTTTSATSAAGSPSPPSDERRIVPGGGVVRPTITARRPLRRHLVVEAHRQAARGDGGRRGQRCG